MCFCRDRLQLMMIVSAPSFFANPSTRLRLEPWWGMTITSTFRSGFSARICDCAKNSMSPQRSIFLPANSMSVTSDLSLSERMSVGFIFGPGQIIFIISVFLSMGMLLSGSSSRSLKVSMQELRNPAGEEVPDFCRKAELT